MTAKITGTLGLKSAPRSFFETASYIYNCEREALKLAIAEGDRTFEDLSDMPRISRSGSIPNWVSSAIVGIHTPRIPWSDRDAQAEMRGTDVRG